MEISCLPSTDKSIVDLPKDIDADKGYNIKFKKQTQNKSQSFIQIIKFLHSWQKLFCGPQQV